MESWTNITGQGAPLKLLHEIVGFVVEIELCSGDRYHGQLNMVEDNMNVWMHDVVHTAPNGQKKKVDATFIRGSNILFVICPDMFANAKLFKTGEMELQKDQPKRKIKRTFSAVKVKKHAH